MTETEPSAWARAKAFNALTRYPDCLKDDTVMNDLIDEIAEALDEARRFGMQEVSQAWFVEKEPKT